jgi:choline dehydrogenase
MAQYIVKERSPDNNVQTDDEWRAFIRETALGIYHPAGTCKMGHDKMAVVDDKLRVHGLVGLYVADASIMPFVVSANLNANCLMIGEKAADMIKAGHR